MPFKSLEKIKQNQEKSEIQLREIVETAKKDIQSRIDRAERLKRAEKILNSKPRKKL